MTRQVDVKALVSHIVRGDGADKCRICLADTAEGQVYLEDTVMMDGDKPVTLAELLENITGIEVPLDGVLPLGLCSKCSNSALAAANFQALCSEARVQWDTALNLLDQIPSKSNTNIVFAIIHNKKITILDSKPNNDKQKNSIKKIIKKLPKKFKRNAKKIPKHSCKCPDCGKHFLYAQHLYDHLKESTDNKNACYICAKIMTREELLKHLPTHKKESFDCKKCPALFRSYKLYVYHLQKAHISGACTCGDCGRSFKSNHAYHAHQHIHSPKNCPRCDKLFRNQSCYVYHVKKCCDLDVNRQNTHYTKHKVTVEVKNERRDKRIRVGLRGSADSECICDYCGKKFAGKKFVVSHIQIVHLKNTHKPCFYCGKLLAAAHMTEHLKRHEQSRSYTCEHCGIVLKSHLGYVQHVRLHTGEKPYACKYCNATFSASSRRSEHIRNKHKKSDIVLKNVCKLCPAKFRLPYQLKKHIEAVHGRNNTDFVCAVCFEKFGSCRGLLHHHRLKHQVNDDTNEDEVKKTCLD